MMRGRMLGSVIAILTATLGTTLARAHDHDHGDAFQTLSAKDQQRAGELVNIVRGATARYRDVASAQAEGYELMFGCVSGSEWGAMGLHYVNMALVVDGKLDATRPEIVIYEPLPHGRRRIVGADYLVFAADWHATNTAAPQIEGQLMHLIESPNRYGLPAFYTLHVWAWKDNPNGSFVNWHPKVSCDAFEG
jgi:hypothetical protein